MRSLLFLRSLLILLCSCSAIAFAAGQGPAGQAQSATSGLQMANVQPLQDIEGVVSWNTLAQVKQTKSKSRITPVFSNDVTALNDKEVKIQGFMMPLDPGPKQKHFLVSVNSATCAYCMPAGPEGVVEVQSKTPIKYTFEPVVVSGKLAVLKDHPMGLYYRLTNAESASAK